MSPDRAPLRTAADARAYALAGNARLTLLSTKTGVRFTYRVRAKDVAQHVNDRLYFVSVLTGSDNESDYTYLGIICDGATTYRRGTKSTIGWEAPSAKAFAYFWENVTAGILPTQLEVWHEGSCGRCGRPLTDPESIARGIGPVCAESGS